MFCHVLQYHLRCCRQLSSVTLPPRLNRAMNPESTWRWNVPSLMPRRAATFCQLKGSMKSRVSAMFVSPMQNCRRVIFPRDSNSRIDDLPLTTCRRTPYPIHKKGSAFSFPCTLPKPWTGLNQNTRRKRMRPHRAHLHSHAVLILKYVQYFGRTTC